MANTESVSHDDLAVCACAGREYTARDAIEGSLFRGELDAKWQAFLQRVAAEKHAGETDMDLDEDAIDSAAEQFRYRNDLITAEETEQWLAMRGLSLDDFSDYFAREYCGNALSEKVTPEQVDYFSAPNDLRQVFVTDLILSGDLDLMITELSWRLAAGAAAAKEEVDSEKIETLRRDFFERSGLSPEQLPRWLERIGRDPAWFDLMFRAEMEYRRRSESLLTPQTRQRELTGLRLPLTRFETEVIELESRDAAQEALFCVREDGMSMEEVAVEGRYPYKTISFLQEDIPAELQQKFLSVVVGDVLDPISRGDGFELYRVTSKSEPSEKDPAVQERVESLLLHRHFTELAARHIEPRLHAVTAPE